MSHFEQTISRNFRKDLRLIGYALKRATWRENARIKEANVNPI